MIQLDLNDPAAPLSPPASLFDGIAFPTNAFCEAYQPTGALRDHWHPLIRALDAMGADLLDQRQKRAQRMRHEDGATYNPFDDPSGRGTPWALEVIPLPLTSADWGPLEAGLIQRARLLERILADTYGPQNLLKQGHLPAELVFANPHFLRGCHDVRPAGDRYLTYYAADLYRDTDGRFRVYRDFADSPAGLGYALENRIVISRIFPQLYHQNQILRLAPFFHTFHQNMVRRTTISQDDPGIVLLSPGPGSRIYFEHALLSRYLGYPLVEGQDLSVRKGQVFLKKLAGLDPVGSIFRHIPDDAIDPFTLRRDPGMGIAGIVQAARDRQVNLINPIGSGLVETPALAVYLPVLCRQVLGEELMLDNHSSWWCGSPDGQAHVLANLDQLAVRHAFERTASIDKSNDLQAAIQAAPYQFIAGEPLSPAVVPAWSPEGACARLALLRVFACATEQGFTVMPGGLAITAADADTLIEDCPERQQSKDIWVLSDQPVEPFSLMSGLRSVASFRRGSDLPSRVADHLLWLGRYLERAEGLIRLLRSVYRRLAGEARPADVDELPFLLDLLRADNTIPPASGEDGKIPMVRELSAQLDEALYRQDRPESVVSVLKQVQEAARNVRDRLSLDSWRSINRLERFTDAPAGDPLEHLNDTLFTLSAFSGLAMESMTRGFGWRFMDMGRRVERGMNQAALVRLSLPQVCDESRSVLEALLEVFDSIMTYRARYRTTFQLAPVLDLLIVDESNPKSLAFQCVQLVSHTENLPISGDSPSTNPESQLARQMCDAVSRIDLVGLRCAGGNLAATDLAGFLESMETRLKDFAQMVSAHYLARIPTTPHFSMISSGRRP